MKKNHSFKRNKSKTLKKNSLQNNNGFRLNNSSYKLKQENKPKGKPIEIMGKYQTLARDATSAGDRIAAENYMQHAEHYLRISNANREKKVDN
tara:strand:- start:2250 stop:2528 length:279 start_codon:yes stop_codon:yes gene_type:complete